MEISPMHSSLFQQGNRIGNHLGSGIQPVDVQPGGQPRSVEAHPVLAGTQPPVMQGRHLAAQAVVELQVSLLKSYLS